MLILKKLTEETLTKANVLTYQQMSKVVGGKCALRCDQTIDVEDYDQGVADGTIIEVSDCSRETAGGNCGSLDKVVCSC